MNVLYILKVLCTELGLKESIQKKNKKQKKKKKKQGDIVGSG
jgi:hypothetical protein